MSESNGHGSGIITDDETYHARLPHPNPPPEGEGAADSLREFRANPCMSCGACCAHFRIVLHREELVRVPRKLTNQLNEQAFCMKGTDVYPPRCIALEGEVGQAVRCGIYDNRPQVCREFNEYELDGSPNPSCFKLRGLVPPAVRR